MISGLQGFRDSEPLPQDAASIKLTADCLIACNLIFERGILSRKVTKGINFPVLENIKDGFQFFVNWFGKHKEKGESFDLHDLQSLDQHVHYNASCSCNTIGHVGSIQIYSYK